MNSLPLIHSARVRRGAVVVAVSASLLAPLTAPISVGQASAAPGITATDVLSSKVITPGREIGLAGTINTRTLAGYIGHDGRKVNDRVLRSDNLSKLTASDIAKLRKRNLVTVVDLRTDIERRVQPDRRIPGAKQVTADVLGQVSPLTLVDVQSAYPEFVNNANARNQIRATLIEIKAAAASGKTSLFHCSAGKDRTGWVAATLLTILGVDRATINADYLASNYYRHASANNPLDGVNMGMLNAAYSAANRKYGSMDGYIRKGLRLTEGDIASLRKHLLS